MVMTFVLYPLSHYNSITKPCARFLLSLLKGLIIDFPSHFILLLMYVYKDTTTRDKLIFPLTITQLLHHFSVSYPKSPHFSIMCVVDAATIRRSEAQFQPKQPRTETSTPLASSTPSTSAGGVTLKAVMAQLQRMDACLDTLITELYQMNTRVSRIARQQARLGGFVESPSPSPEASEDEDDDDDSDGVADGDKASGSSNDDEMTASSWLSLFHS